MNEQVVEAAVDAYNAELTAEYLEAADHEAIEAAIRAADAARAPEIIAAVAAYEAAIRDDDRAEDSPDEYPMRERLDIARLELLSRFGIEGAA